MFSQCQINLFNLLHVLMYPIYYLHVSTCTTEKRNSKGMAGVYQDIWWGDCLQNQNSWLQFKIENNLEASSSSVFIALYLRFYTVSSLVISVGTVYFLIRCMRTWGNKIYFLILNIFIVNSMHNSPNTW